MKCADKPGWFAKAMAVRPEIGSVSIEGARIEWAAWGERGRPGLLLLGGNGAHIGWWRPIAPMLARDFRVATLSWSGMGGSQWRDLYSVDLFMAEALAVAEVAGLFDAPCGPLVAAHSFGGFTALTLAVRHGPLLRGAMLIDTRLLPRTTWGDAALPAQPFRIYETREEAIRNFRLRPPQPERNRFLLDALAAESVIAVEGGWTWRADPAMQNKTPITEDFANMVGQATCPLMFVRGELSETLTDEIWDGHRRNAPPGTPFVDIPDSHHHVMIDQPIATVAVMRTLFGQLA